MAATLPIEPRRPLFFRVRIKAVERSWAGILVAYRGDKGRKGSGEGSHQAIARDLLLLRNYVIIGAISSIK